MDPESLTMFISAGAASIAGLSALLAARIARATHRETQNAQLRQDKASLVIKATQILTELNLHIAQLKVQKVFFDDLKVQLQQDDEYPFKETAESFRIQSETLEEILDNLKTEGKLHSMHTLTSINVAITSAEIYLKNDKERLKAFGKVCSEIDAEVPITGSTPIA